MLKISGLRQGVIQKNMGGSMFWKAKKQAFSGHVKWEFEGTTFTTIKRLNKALENAL